MCGAEVPRGALACRECGADENTGWDEDRTRLDGIDLPGEAFDYEESLRQQGLKKSVLPRGISPFWWAVGLMLLLILGGATVFRFL